MSPTTNLLHPLPNDLTDEVFTELIRQGAVRIERPRFPRRLLV
ncbi:hypothetical protein [Candidatus Contendibacter odensensis]|nr:hypothetical protein [Candidatus Contendobacter odensis]